MLILVDAEGKKVSVSPQTMQREIMGLTELCSRSYVTNNERLIILDWVSAVMRAIDEGPLYWIWRGNNIIDDNDKYAIFKDDNILADLSRCKNTIEKHSLLSLTSKLRKVLNTIGDRDANKLQVVSPYDQKSMVLDSRWSGVFSYSSGSKYKSGVNNIFRSVNKLEVEKLSFKEFTTEDKMLSNKAYMILTDTGFFCGSGVYKMEREGNLLAAKIFPTPEKAETSAKKALNKAKDHFSYSIVSASLKVDGIVMKGDISKYKDNAAMVISKLERDSIDRKIASGTATNRPKF